MNKFPPVLGSPKLDSWTSVERDTVRATDMDEGPPKRRANSSVVIYDEACRFEITTAQRAVLLDFYAANKAIRFDLDHWFSGPVEACFAGPIQWRRITLNRWQADFMLEVYP